MQLLLVGSCWCILKHHSGISSHWIL